MTRRRVKFIGWLCVGAVYVLTLVTQLPHIYDVYASLESADHTLFGVNTALGAAIAFEASVAIFTLRAIINTKAERSRWTRYGIVAFLCVSAIANVSYYFDISALDDAIMPMILALALPFALWLYAEEFGRGARAQAKRNTSSPVAKPSVPVANEPPAKPYTCDQCGESFDVSQEYASHIRWQHK